MWFKLPIAISILSDNMQLIHHNYYKHSIGNSN